MSISARVKSCQRGPTCSYDSLFANLTICNKNGKGYISAAESSTQLMGVAITHAKMQNMVVTSIPLCTEIHRNTTILKYDHINLCVTMVGLCRRGSHALVASAEKSM